MSRLLFDAFEVQGNIVVSAAINETLNAYDSPTIPSGNIGATINEIIASSTESTSYLLKTTASESAGTANHSDTTNTQSRISESAGAANHSDNTVVGKLLSINETIASTTHSDSILLKYSINETTTSNHSDTTNTQSQITESAGAANHSDSVNSIYSKTINEATTSTTHSDVFTKFIAATINEATTSSNHSDSIKLLISINETGTANHSDTTNTQFRVNETAGTSDSSIISKLVNCTINESTISTNHSDSILVSKSYTVNESIATSHSEKITLSVRINEGIAATESFIIKLLVRQSESTSVTESSIPQVIKNSSLNEITSVTETANVQVFKYAFVNETIDSTEDSLNVSRTTYSEANETSEVFENTSVKTFIGIWLEDVESFEDSFFKALVYVRELETHRRYLEDNVYPIDSMTNSRTLYRTHNELVGSKTSLAKPFSPFMRTLSTVENITDDADGGLAKTVEVSLATNLSIKDQM